MGAYSFMLPYLEWVLDQLGSRGKLLYAGRPASAASPPGSCRSISASSGRCSMRRLASAATVGGDHAAIRGIGRHD